MKKVISNIMRWYAFNLLIVAEKMYHKPVDYSVEEKLQAECRHNADDLMTICCNCGKVMADEDKTNHTFYVSVDFEHPWAKPRTYTR
jgi:hypothetical protein